MKSKPENKQAPKLVGRSTLSVNIAISALTFAAAGQWLLLITNFAHLRQSMAGTKLVIVDWDQSLLMMHIRIGMALAIGASALLLRRGIGLLLSALALIWVCLEYLSWYIRSKAMKTNAEIQEFPPLIPHALNLYGASPWNVAILILVIALLAWEVKLWVDARRTNDLNCQSDGR